MDVEHAGTAQARPGLEALVQTFSPLVASDSGPPPLFVAPPARRKHPYHVGGYALDAVSPVETVREALATVAERDTTVGAFATVIEEQALADARRAEAELAQGIRRGPLHGVPVAVKDIIAVAGVRRCAGSKHAYDDAPPDDAAVVRLLREAGAIVVGTTRLDEFAFATLGAQTCNPLDESRWCGGSSGGSAAAVAAGMCAAALGTDTGGSVRIPAAFCRIVGLKPTYGLLRTEGVLALAWSLDHVGVLGRTSRDVALTLGAVVDAMPGDAYLPTDDDGLSCRVGVPSDVFLETVEASVHDEFTASLQTLASAGAQLIPVQLPSPEEVLALHTIVILAEAAAYHRRLRVESYGAHVRGALEFGGRIAACDYLDAQRARGKLAREIDTTFRRVDLLALPTVPMEPGEVGTDTVILPALGEVGAIPATVRHTALFNHSGHPAVSVPFSNSRVLGALQLVGRHYAERPLLQAAHVFERASGRSS